MIKYEFVKIEDKPTLTSEYSGETRTKVSHSKKHRFNLELESKQKLLDIAMKYGITKKDFTEEDKKKHPFFYNRILSNNLRFGTGIVYYYYNEYLEDLDRYNGDSDIESYKNGIVVYGTNDAMSIGNAYRLTEVEHEKEAQKPENERVKGFNKETIEEFKQFFLEKRRGHDFKKDFDDIRNAEDNAVEYETNSQERYYSKNKSHIIENPIKTTAKSPRMDFILNKTNLTEEAKFKFKKYSDLKDFVERVDLSKFNKHELKEFFDAVDKIDNEYMLHYELMDKVDELKTSLGI